MSQTGRISSIVKRPASQAGRRGFEVPSPALDVTPAKPLPPDITLAPKKLIRTRRASEGSASEPSLARRVSMCKDAKLSCRGNTHPRRMVRCQTRRNAEKFVGARQLVRQDGGRMAHIAGPTRCKLPGCAPTRERLQIFRCPYEPVASGQGAAGLLRAPSYDLFVWGRV